MPQAAEYLHIWAWGRFMQSDASYILNEQHKAAEDNAPLDAIFKDAKDGHWHTFAQVTAPTTREHVESILNTRQPAAIKQTKSKVLFLLALFVLTFASADATSRKTDRIQVVIRGEENGPWKAYLFGASCKGSLEVHQPTGSDEPLEIVCK